MKHIFSSLPARLLLAVVLAAACGAMLPLSTLRFFFTISFAIRAVLEFFLPFLVFFFVSTGVMVFRKNSLAMVLLLLATVFVSNVVTSLYTYGFGSLLIGQLGGAGAAQMLVNAHEVLPYLSFQLPSMIRSEHALMAALIVGILQTFLQVPGVSSVLQWGKRGIEWGMSNLFIPVVPVYVFGFFLKMVKELPINKLFGLYGFVFIATIIMQLLYLFLLYLVARRGNLSRAVSSITIAAPSYLTALGTMSSVATVPVSVVCAEENSGNGPLARFAMPIFANIHLAGDAVCVPLFCLATMNAFFGVLPTFGAYILFIGYFCLTMLAVSGVPGGGIIVMLPLLQSLFGFTPEMLSVMTTLYLLQDGFGTAANVMGDGALVIILDKLSRLFGLSSQEQSQHNVQE